MLHDWFDDGRSFIKRNSYSPKNQLKLINLQQQETKAYTPGTLICLCSIIHLPIWIIQWTSCAVLLQQWFILFISIVVAPQNIRKISIFTTTVDKVREVGWCLFKFQHLLRYVVALGNFLTWLVTARGVITWGGVLFLTQAWALLKWKFIQVHI